MQQPDPDVERPWWHDPELDPDVLVLRGEEADPKDEVLRWIGNGSERASLVVMGVWYAASGGWFGSGVTHFVAHMAGALVMGFGCLGVGAFVRRRRPELFEAEPAEVGTSTGGW